MAHANWVAKFDGMDPDDRDRNPLEDALRTESSPFLISRQRYNQVLRRRGGRLPREGLDDLYEAAVLRDMEALKIVRGLPQSPMVPCVRRLSTVSSALHLGDTAFIAALLGVEADDVQSVAGLLRSTGYACLSNFAHSHMGPRRVLFGAVEAVPAEMVPADVLPVAVPDALVNLIRGITMDCGVCLETMREPTTLPDCGHSFCRGCLCRMHVQVCPTCRVPFEDPEALPVNIILRDHAARHDEVRAWIAANTNSAANAPQNPAPAPPAPAVEAVAVPAPEVAFDVRTSVLSLDATRRQARALNPAEAVEQYFRAVDEGERDCKAIAVAFGEPDPTSRRVLRDNIMGLSNSQIVTLLRRAGVVAECGTVFEAIRDVTKVFLEAHVRRSISRMQYAHVLTLMAREAVAGVPHCKTIVGFGHSTVRDVWTPSLLSVLRQVHPGLRFTPEGLSVLHDLVTDVMLRVLAKAMDMRNELYAVRCTDVRIHEDGDGEDDDEDYTKQHLPLRYYYVANAGPVGDNGQLDATHTVRLFLYDDDDERSEDRRLETPVRCALLPEVVTAGGQVLAGELRRHAVSEATKASTKFGFSEHKQPYVGSAARKAGLQFEPEHVALVAERVRSVNMTPNAAIALTAVIEYVSAEIIELAGNWALDSGDTYISPRHIMLAVHGDEELKATFRHCVFRGAGVPPSILPQIQPACLAVGGPSFLETVATTAMAARSEEMISAGTMPTFVDPRTGFHYEVKAAAEGGAGVVSAVPCPVLDDLSRETREERQRKAAAALPAAVAKQMKEEGFRLRFKESYKGDDFEFEGDEDDGDDLEDGWAKETVLHAHRRRLEDIRVAQADTRFAFEIIPFSNFVREVIQDFRTFFPITAEAMEVLQTCAEAHVLEVIRDAYSVAIKRSPVLTADDIDTVRQLREQLQGAV